ncbi:hypothetical protein ABBQ38_001886 [Trebouxia sp. C0009 RCD-2024]
MTTCVACTVDLYSYRQQRCSRTPKAASLHRDKLHARWLPVQPPAVLRKGHLQCQVTASHKPGQPDGTPPMSPDISMLSPELQEQWHVDSNRHLGAVKVKQQSAIKAVWQCNKCPAGQPHVWTAPVHRRTRGSQCPYCSNRRVCLHNSLATIAPETAKYWNHSKNRTAPEQVLAGSSSTAMWKCPACRYEWKAPIYQRVRSGSGCPKCSHKNQKRNSQPTFAEAQPACLAEWDHEHNEADGFYPHKVTLGSSKLVHWICSRCPRGQPHRWTATPLNRISNGTGCPACTGQQVCLCNSLESLFPSIAAEFDIDANGFAPSEVTAMSAKKVWWRNAKRGSWRRAVYFRTYRRNQLVTKQGVWRGVVAVDALQKPIEEWLETGKLLSVCPFNGIAAAVALYRLSDLDHI